jgi:hypothetical protein
MNVRLGLVALAISASSAFACSASAPSAVGEDSRLVENSSSACLEQHRTTSSDGEAIISCDALYEERPFVRPPADVIQGSTVELVAGFDTNGGPDAAHAAFVTRDGTNYVLLDTTGNPQPTSLLSAQFTAQVLPAMRMPSNRNLYTLYAVEGRTKIITVDGTAATGIQVTSVKPAVVLPGAVIDGAFRVWEGEFAPPTGSFAPAYDWDRAVRFRMRVDRLEPAGPPFHGHLPVWDNLAITLPDGELFAAQAIVENADEAVRAADGSCLAPVTGGPFNPLTVVPDAKFSLLRFPGMHIPGDQVFTIAPVTVHGSGDQPEGMTGLYINHPASFLMTNPIGKWSEASFTPHGFPSNISVRMRPVFTGGGSCESARGGQRT